MNTLAHSSLTGSVLLLAGHFFGADLRHLVFMVFVMATNLVFQAWIKHQVKLADQEPEAGGRKHKQRLQQWGRAIFYGYFVVIVLTASSAIPNR